MSRLVRRRFLEESLLAATAVTIGAPLAARAATRRSADDTLRLAVLGCGVRGKQHVEALGKLSGCEIAAVCDPDQERLDALAARVAEKQGSTPLAVRDMRRIFDDPSIDCVFVATCNHWHALAAVWAMQAGKHVYCEKPVSHNISEGRQIVETSRRTGLLCQTGTQRRSHEQITAAVDYMRSGKLGEVHLARSIIFRKREPIGGPGTYAIPRTVDYNLWAGPAPMSPLVRPNFHYDWHWFWETGNGELGNNNIHMVDVCRWGLGVQGLGRQVVSFGGRFNFDDAAQTPNTQVCVHDFGDKAIIQETRNLQTGPFHPRYDGGFIFYGTDGMIVGTSGCAVFDHDGNKLHQFEGGEGDHFANFIDAVRSGRRDDLHADIAQGHQSTGLCHVGNISYRLGEAASPREVRAALEQLRVADDAVDTLDRVRQHLADNDVNLRQTRFTLGPTLQIDGERFVGNRQANALLTREYRAPFAMPSGAEA